VSPRRIFAVALRHYYLHRSSWPRMLDLIYWPIVNLLLWGLISRWLDHRAGTATSLVGLLLGALILWDVLFRSQVGVALAFLEEIWSRNLVNLFVSPLTPLEFAAAQVTVAALRALVAATAMSIVALALFAFDVFTLGPPLVAFFLALLLMGASIGFIVSGLILRYGQGAENLAWAIIFLFQPVSAVFYPVDALPGWLQPVALATPAAHVFEGMRHVLETGGLDPRHLAAAFGLDVVYLALGAGFFALMLRRARRDGLILQVGE